MMRAPLPPELLETLRRLDACTLSNAIETFRHRLRNEGFVDHTVRSMTPVLPPMLGYAVTVTIRGSAPPTAGLPYRESTDWLEFVQSLPAPRVVVIQDLQTRVGLGSLIGAVHMNVLRALQCSGIVTNGSVRDLPAAADAGFQLFAGSVSVSHAYVHVVEFGAPVEIGGLPIRSGDLLHGDQHGVQTIPLDVAPEIPAVAGRLRAQELEIIDLCNSRNFSVDQLRELVARHRR